MKVLFVLAMTLSLAQAPGNPFARDPLDDFVARAEAYALLRRQVASVTTPRLEPMSDAQTICDARDALAAALIKARPNAHIGDLFAPAAADILRARIRRAATRDALRAWFHDLYSENQTPPRRRVTIHMRASVDEFSPVIPIALLQLLPPVRSELAYRIAGRDLLLVDADAEVVIDLLPEALPGPLRP